MLVKPADTRARRLLSSLGTDGNFALSGDMFILTEHRRLFRFRAGSQRPRFRVKNVRRGQRNGVKPQVLDTRLNLGYFIVRETRAQWSIDGGIEK